MHWRSLSTTYFTRILPALLICLALGCGGGGGTSHVSGKITFMGNPVPAGKIYFVPDASKGNSGPTGYADIKNGEYDTSDAGCKAPVVGPVIIAIEGIDTSAPPDKSEPDVTAKLLFTGYEEPYDVPKSSTTKNIDVPASAAGGPTPSKKGATIIIP
jgi:hypothetical protein